MSRRAGLHNETCYVCQGQGEKVSCQLKDIYQRNEEKDYHHCRGWRLPTEAEWEFAARSGSREALYTGPIVVIGERNAPTLDKIAWYGGNSGVSYPSGFDCSGWKDKQYPSSQCGTHPVGRKQANEWHLYDMLGNVSEWCWDVYWYRNTAESATDPVANPSGKTRSFRGGSWYTLSWYTRLGQTAGNLPHHRAKWKGFPLARRE